MSLIEEINGRRKEIRTDDYPMSIGEWISLYESNELDIHPEFQRFFRWSNTQKTNLIESILLGIPLPPVFVSQRDDGVWDVVDGLQRLSTIFQLVGVLKDENDDPVPPLVLEKTEYLPSLEGRKWEDEDNSKSLPSEARLLLKRSKVHVSIVLKESDEKTKYDLFQRLNTGGSQLSPQEVRNCILVMLNRNFFNWLRELVPYEPFQNSIALSERPLSESYDMELLLRLFIFSEIDENKISEVGDVGAYITKMMRVLCQDANFDFKEMEKLFKSTFDIIYDTVGEKAFKRYNVGKSRHEGGFLISQFETVAFGIAYNLHRGTLGEDIAGKVAALWSEKEFTAWTGTGITASRRLPHLIPLGRKHFAK
ncbi:DUF262 domain-containing protein [Mesorhizobium sp. B2-4-11]|nr:DUF262 domain-containing protein [Mesorhizobium sp. B2-4-11]